jgi:hypothetical protein
LIGPGLACGIADNEAEGDGIRMQLLMMEHEPTSGYISYCWSKFTGQLEKDFHQVRNYMTGFLAKNSMNCTAE